jgi:hypothetical protein
VIEPGDLIIAKLIAARPKDLDDAMALWRLHGATIDETRIRDVLRQLQDALAQSDLLPAFDAIVARQRPL